IFDNYMGISKISAKEIVYRALKDGNGEIDFREQIDRLCVSFINFFDNVKESSFCPTILKDERGQYMDILPFTYIQYAPQLQESYDSPSQAIDIFYFER